LGTSPARPLELGPLLLHPAHHPRPTFAPDRNRVPPIRPQDNPHPLRDLCLAHGHRPRLLPRPPPSAGRQLPPRSLSRRQEDRGGRGVRGEPGEEPLSRGLRFGGRGRGRRGGCRGNDQRQVRTSIYQFTNLSIFQSDLLCRLLSYKNYLSEKSLKKNL
jgi:hypothetical protein